MAAENHQEIKTKLQTVKKGVWQIPLTCQLSHSNLYMLDVPNFD